MSYLLLPYAVTVQQANNVRENKVKIRLKVPKSHFVTLKSSPVSDGSSLDSI